MSTVEANPQPQAYHRPGPAREPREPRQQEIDFSPIGGIVPVAILAGIVYVGYTYKDKIFEILKNIESNVQSGIKDLPPITLPSSDNDNPVGGQTAPTGTNTDAAPVSSTGQWYKANGPTAPMPNARKSTSKCGTGSGNSGGCRWENVVNGFMDIGFEVVVYFSINSGTMCGGGHIGLKHGGPNHKASGCYTFSGACCCWWDSGIDNDQGKTYLEIERPHPHNLNRKYFIPVGTKLDSGKPIGVRWHISKEGAGIRLMQWIDTSGVTGANKWQLSYNVLDTGQFMPKDYYSHITNSQNIEIRISDVAFGDIKMLQGPTSRKIVSGGSAALAKAYSYPAHVDESRPLYAPRISMS